MSVQPKDVIAGIVIIGLVVLKIFGLNGELDTAVALIIGYYFGHRITKVDNGT